MNNNQITVIFALLFSLPALVLGFHPYSEIGCFVTMVIMAFVAIIYLASEQDSGNNPPAFQIIALYLIAFMVLIIMSAGHQCADPLHYACDGLCACDGLGCYQ